MLNQHNIICFIMLLTKEIYLILQLAEEFRFA